MKTTHPSSRTVNSLFRFMGATIREILARTGAPKRLPATGRRYRLRVPWVEDAAELLIQLANVPDTLLAFALVTHEQPAPGLVIEIVSTLDLKGIHRACRQCERPAAMIAAVECDPDSVSK